MNLLIRLLVFCALQVFLSCSSFSHDIRIPGAPLESQYLFVNGKRVTPEYVARIIFPELRTDECYINMPTNLICLREFEWIFEFSANFHWAINSSGAPDYRTYLYELKKKIQFFSSEYFFINECILNCKFIFRKNEKRSVISHNIKMLLTGMNCINVNLLERINSEERHVKGFEVSTYYLIGKGGGGWGKCFKDDDGIRTLKVLAAKLDAGLFPGKF